MCQKPLLSLFLLFLGLSFFISSSAVPSSRSLKSVFEGQIVQDFVDQDAKDMKNSEEAFEMVRRMDLDNTSDYPGTGANNHHDPRAPGKA